MRAVRVLQPLTNVPWFFKECPDEDNWRAAQTYPDEPEGHKS